MTATDLDIAPSDKSTDDELMHVVCESCRRRFCDGEHDFEPLVDWAEYPNDYIVCDHLDDAMPRCPHCGAP